MYFQITWPRLWHENNIKREEENLHNGFGQLNIDEQKTFLCLRKPICRNRALNFKQRKIYIQRNYYICSIFKYRNTVSKTYHFHLTPNEEQDHQILSLKYDKIFEKNRKSIMKFKDDKNLKTYKSHECCMVRLSWELTFPIIQTRTFWMSANLWLIFFNSRTQNIWHSPAHTCTD